MDDDPAEVEVPAELLELIFAPQNWELLCSKWTEMYPMNPIEDSHDESKGEDDDIKDQT